MQQFLIILSTILFSIPFHANTDFEEGYYFSKTGEKIEGLIKLKKSDYSSFKKKFTRIIFKSSESSTTQSFSIEDIKSFVVAQDSFAIVKDIKVNHLNGKFEKDFAKVIETGDLNLYQHQSRVSDGSFFYDKEHFVLSKDEETYLGIWNLNKQREEISLLISEKPELMQRFLSKEFDDNIPQLVALYNQ